MIIGDYLNRDELYEIKVIEREGIQVAFLAYTYSTNGLRLPANSELIIPYYNNEELIISQIAKAKEVSDAVIVSMHWGDEDVFTPNATQKRLAQLLADHGVLAIIGHHPHVLQPIEWITGSGGNRMLCVYSLGNLANGMIRPKNMIGGFINFDIVKRGDKIAVENPILTPTIYYYAQNWFNGHIYLLEDYTEELALNHGTRTRHGFNRTLDELWGYVTRNIDAEFLK
jgi:poly-gamma-glutamate synthesis protein (capsule biosynthesis protein)